MLKIEYLHHVAGKENGINLLAVSVKQGENGLIGAISAAICSIVEHNFSHIEILTKINFYPIVVA